jgi:pectin methylesterase-like acyl-CoA thioesterase
MGTLTLRSDNDFTIENDTSSSTATYNIPIGINPGSYHINFTVPQPKTGIKLVKGSGSASKENISINNDNYVENAYGYDVNDTNKYTAGTEYKITYEFKFKYEHIYTEETKEYIYKLNLRFKAPGGSGTAD